MSDLQIYRKAASLLEAGQNAALITVVSTAGSTPGKVGYKMLVWGEPPQTLGTVGGGLSEAEMMNAARNLLGQPASAVFKLDMTADEGERGICGGSVEFLIETFDDAYIPLFKQVSTAFARGQTGALVSVLRPGLKPVKSFVEDLDKIADVGGLRLSPKDIEAIKTSFAREPAAKIALSDGTALFFERIAALPMLLIVGAGHIASHIVRLAGPLGFRTTVCDDRPEYANRQRFLDADNIIVDSFEGIFEKAGIDGDTYVVIVTRGHRADRIALEQAIRHCPRYIGMIGSKNKSRIILESLKQKGVSADELGRVYSPIGLSIGAVTPEEIAISIVSELIKVRRSGDDAAIGHMKLAGGGSGRKESQ
jgi:xanthine dehydrogenase accessory factor